MSSRAQRGTSVGAVVTHATPCPEVPRCARGDDLLVIPDPELLTPNSYGFASQNPYDPAPLYDCTTQR